MISNHVMPYIVITGLSKEENEGLNKLKKMMLTR